MRTKDASEKRLYLALLVQFLNFIVALAGAGELFAHRLIITVVGIEGCLFSLVGWTINRRRLHALSAEDRALCDQWQRRFDQEMDRTNRRFW